MASITNIQARLLIQMITWMWQGDPELVGDKHWEAYQEVCEASGIDYE